jgi:hypothetical protein
MLVTSALCDHYTGPPHPDRTDVRDRRVARLSSLLQVDDARRLVARVAPCYLVAWLNTGGGVDD